MSVPAPDNTAVRTALWRALHVPGVERAAQGARASGTPWRSFFTPAEILALAMEAGFASVEHVSSGALAERYFAGRKDGLRPPNTAEELLVAAT